MKLTSFVFASLYVAAVMAENVTQPVDASEIPGVSSLNEPRAFACAQPSGAVEKWYYNTFVDGPNYCSKYDDDNEWAMLNAYRSGGKENSHWKYTDDENDPECLTNWKYYKADGRNLITTVARTTTLNDNRRWCALPVYRSGGQQAKQWAYCVCW